jgi:hypothetical protein
MLFAEYLAAGQAAVVVGAVWVVVQVLVVTFAVVGRYPVFALVQLFGVAFEVEAQE